MDELTIRYKNELNTIPLRKFTEKEIDLFFLLCKKVQRNQTEYLRFYFYELKEMSAAYDQDIERFIKDLESIQKKLLKLSYREETDNEIRHFSLFQGFIISKKFKYVELSLGADVKYVLMKLTNEFTPSELRELVELSSNYSKIIYRLLLKSKDDRHCILKMEDFKLLLDIPDSYRMSDITRQILKPTEKELSSIFGTFKINKIKAKKGNKIDFIEFLFTEK